MTAVMSSVIHIDNRMITGAYIVRIVWITKIIKRHRNIEKAVKIHVEFYSFLCRIIAGRGARHCEQ